MPDPGARGLRIVIQPSGEKSFAVRFRIFGRTRKLTLGTVQIGLAEARALAADAMLAVAKGVDPGAAKAAARAKALDAREDTVKNISLNYLRREGPKLRTGKIRERVLEKLVFPHIGSVPIESVKRSDLVRLFDKIEDKNGPRQADSCLAYLRKIMNWHASRSDEFRSPIIRGMGRYNSKAHERERVLTDGELQAVWKAAEAADVFGSLVRFLLLSACRRAEATGLTWSELEGDLWRLPAARNKGKQELVRPLSKAARAIVDDQPKIEGTEFVFRSIGFSQAKKKFDLACGVSGWRVHDLRRTSRTLMSRAGVSVDTAERVLGHVIGGVRRVYDIHPYVPEMRHAVEALSTAIQNIVSPTDNVTPMRRPRAAP